MSDSRKILTVRALVPTAVFVVVAPLLPMIISGDWRWWGAWAYVLATILQFTISRALAARRNPDLLVERSRSLTAKDTKRWDKILAPILGLSSFVILGVAGLDHSYRWSLPFSLAVELIALAGLLLGYVLSSWAFIENRFFSGVVRIQTDRGHRVVSSGPYRIVRHPGYAGSLASFIAIPLLLDSLWAFIPTVVLLAAMVIRTALEDRTLQAELAGYVDYARTTRFRLLPGVW